VRIGDLAAFGVAQRFARPQLKAWRASAFPRLTGDTSVTTTRESSPARIPEEELL